MEEELRQIIGVIILLLTMVFAVLLGENFENEYFVYLAVSGFCCLCLGLFLIFPTERKMVNYEENQLETFDDAMKRYKEMEYNNQLDDN